MRCYRNRLSAADRLAPFFTFSDSSRVISALSSRKLAPSAYTGMLTASATAASSATSAHNASPKLARSRLSAVVKTEMIVRRRFIIA